MERITGEYKALGAERYFIPYALPPNHPSFQLDSELLLLYGEAMHQLGKLEEMLRRIPNKKRFLIAYVTKEALLSSQIENIHTTLLDIFSAQEKEQKIEKGTQLVMNYAEAVQHALMLIRDEGLPITSRVIREAHKVLLAGQGGKNSPGEYRKQSVKVGNLVPPAAQEIELLIAGLEKFINEDRSLPPLIKAGLAHVQFETIHPFLDGNGRIGRLLIVLMLISDGLLSEPILYPSYFFKKHHAEYYTRLDSVRLSGDFEGWISYYLRGIGESAKDAWLRAKKIESLEQEVLDNLLGAKTFKTREEAIQFSNLLFEHPVLTIKRVTEVLKLSYNTAKKILDVLIALGVLEEKSGYRRNKVFKFSKYIEILEEEDLF